jgi:hypothetical protein
VDNGVGGGVVSWLRLIQDGKPVCVELTQLA